MTRIAPLVAVAASVLVLSGCWLTPPAPADTDASPDSPASPGPSPAADPVVEPDAPSDVLFTVTASTTDRAGAPVTLTMTGHAPQHWDAAGRETIKNDYVSQCSARGGGTVWEFGAPLIDATLDAYGATLMVIDVESTPAGRALDTVTLLGGSPYYQQLVTGDAVPDTSVAGCYGGSLAVTGTAAITTHYETGRTDGDLAQWLTGAYGFSAGLGTALTISSCTAELTPLAETFDLASLPGWDAPHTSSTACWIGYRGE